MNVRLVVSCLIAILPRRLRGPVGRMLLGWQVDPSAYIGRSIISARTVVLGKGAAIGSFNMIKGLEELTMGDGASIGFFNWISGPSLASGAFPHAPNRRPALVMGERASILNRHIVDCTDTVRLGDYAAVGGYRTTILTHNVNLVTNRQIAAPVVIEDHAVVLTNCVLLSGVTVPARSLVAAGAVVNTPLGKPDTLYRGNPAVEVRGLPANLKFFQRSAAAE